MTAAIHKKTVFDDVNDLVVQIYSLQHRRLQSSFQLW